MQGSSELCHIKKWSDLIIFLRSRYQETSYNTTDSLFQIKKKYLNMLIREYNLTINNNNQKLFIPVQTENDKSKI